MKNNTRLRKLTAAFVLLAASFGYALTDAVQAADSLLDSDEATGRGENCDRIASSLPDAFKLPSGEAQGYMIDVVGTALKALGVQKIDAVTTTFDAMISGLASEAIRFRPRRPEYYVAAMQGRDFFGATHSPERRPLRSTGKSKEACRLRVRRSITGRSPRRACRLNPGSVCPQTGG